MEEEIKTFGILIGSLLLIVLLFVGLELGGIKLGGFFSKERANVSREVFEQGRSFNESKAQDLARYKHQYTLADPDEKEALAALIRDSYADFDPNKLRSESLKSFLSDIMGR